MGTNLKKSWKILKICPGTKKTIFYKGINKNPIRNRRDLRTSISSAQEHALGEKVGGWVASRITAVMPRIIKSYSPADPHRKVRKLSRRTNFFWPTPSKSCKTPSPHVFFFLDCRPPSKSPQTQSPYEIFLGRPHRKVAKLSRRTFFFYLEKCWQISKNLEKSWKICPGTKKQSFIKGLIRIQ